VNVVAIATRDIDRRIKPDADVVAPSGVGLERPAPLAVFWKPVALPMSV
jgi:hypothetical protein